MTVDLHGLDVWPGLIDAASVVGLSEIGSIRETKDFSDSAQFEPELHTSAALRPDSALVETTRANGVLAIFARPTGGLISGQGCVATLGGWVPAEMVVVDPVALCVNVPPYSPSDPERPRPREMPDPNRDRERQLREIREEFKRAADYGRIVDEAKKRGESGPVPDPRLAALVPYTRGEKPVLIQADRRREILGALELVKDLKLKGVVVGGLEAWKVTEELKAAKVPVIVTGVLRMPNSKYDPTDSAYTNPLRLNEAGVPFAIRATVEGADAAATARNQPFEAAFAVSHGLPEDAALRSVTLAPAQILGVEKELGSIEPGKVANLVITAGPILQITSDVKLLFLSGKPVAPTSRHTGLYAKYRERLQEVNRGEARLGLERPAAAAAGGAPAGAP